MAVRAPAELSVKTISILLVLLTRNIFAYFDPPTNENNSPCAGFGSTRAPISLNLKKSVWKKIIVSKLEVPESNSAELAALDKPQHS